MELLDKNEISALGITELQELHSYITGLQQSMGKEPPANLQEAKSRNNIAMNLLWVEQALSDSAEHQTGALTADAFIAIVKRNPAMAKTLAVEYLNAQRMDIRNQALSVLPSGIRDLSQFLGVSYNKAYNIVRGDDLSLETLSMLVLASGMFLKLGIVSLEEAAKELSQNSKWNSLAGKV